MAYNKMSQLICIGIACYFVVIISGAPQTDTISDRVNPVAAAVSSETNLKSVNLDTDKASVSDDFFGPSNVEKRSPRYGYHHHHHPEGGHHGSEYHGYNRGYNYYNRGQYPNW